MKKRKNMMIASVFCSGMLSLSGCGQPQSVYGPPQVFESETDSGETETTQTSETTAAKTEASSAPETAVSTGSAATTQTAAETAAGQQTTETETQPAVSSTQAETNLHTRPRTPSLVYGPPNVDDDEDGTPPIGGIPTVYGPPTYRQ